jgi:CheY-like chemotaxis protein
MTDIDVLIQAVDRADSSIKLLEAVEKLADVQSEKGIPTLIAALGYNNPGAAVAAVDGLIRIGEPAVKGLFNQLKQYVSFFVQLRIADIGMPGLSSFEATRQIKKNRPETEVLISYHVRR